MSAVDFLCYFAAYNAVGIPAALTCAVFTAPGYRTLGCLLWLAAWPVLLLANLLCLPFMLLGIIGITPRGWGRK